MFHPRRIARGQHSDTQYDLSWGGQNAHGLGKPRDSNGLRKLVGFEAIPVRSLRLLHRLILFGILRTGLERLRSELVAVFNKIAGYILA